MLHWIEMICSSIDSLKLIYTNVSLVFTFKCFSVLIIVLVHILNISTKHVYIIWWKKCLSVSKLFFVSFNVQACRLNTALKVYGLIHNPLFYIKHCLGYSLWSSSKITIFEYIFPISQIGCIFIYVEKFLQTYEISSRNKMY